MISKNMFGQFRLLKFKKTVTRFKFFIWQFNKIKGKCLRNNLQLFPKYKWLYHPYIRKGRKWNLRNGKKFIPKVKNFLNSFALTHQKKPRFYFIKRKDFNYVQVCKVLQYLRNRLLDLGLKKKISITQNYALKFRKKLLLNLFLNYV